LNQAKAHFDQGKFQEADAILNAADMQRDLNQLIERDQQLDQEKAEIEQHRTQLANEYLIKARLWTTFYEQPNRFEQSCAYFEEALRAARTSEAVFEYALFLQNHNCFDQAKPLYEGLLQNYRALAQENPRTYLPYVAMTLNNLAILQKAQNELSGAEQNYQEALQIHRALAQENPRTYLPDVATTLYNLAILQKAQNELSGAEQNYQEALQIYRALAQENPRTYLPDVATTLYNLAILQKAQNELSGAEQNCQEALQIRRALAQENPRTYLPDVAMTLINLSIFYLQAIPDKEQSIALATEALEITQQFPQVLMVQRYAETAIQVLARLYPNSRTHCHW
jgi:tetratricopeptide (TPR) repeat protein